MFGLVSNFQCPNLAAVERKMSTLCVLSASMTNLFPRSYCVYRVALSTRVTNNEIDVKRAEGTILRNRPLQKLQTNMGKSCQEIVCTIESTKNISPFILYAKNVKGPRNAVNISWVGRGSKATPSLLFGQPLKGPNGSHVYVKEIESCLFLSQEKYTRSRPFISVV